MLGRFRGVSGTDLAPGGDPHALEPGSDREVAVQGEPDEGVHFLGAGVMPNSSDHLGADGVLEIQLLKKAADARGVGWFPRVLVASLGRIAEEW
jgi:hypothetical protein